MDIEGGQGAGATPVDHALDALSTALDHLVKVVEDGGLDAYDDQGLLGFARSFEQVRRRSGLVDHRLVRDLQTRRVAETLAQPQHGGAAGLAAEGVPGRGGPSGPGGGAAG